MSIILAKRIQPFLHAGCKLENIDEIINLCSLSPEGWILKFFLQKRTKILIKFYATTDRQKQFNRLG